MRDKKSITHKRAAAQDCKGKGLVKGNSPDWYTRENLPYNGENFNVLSSLEPLPDVLLSEGVATNAAIIYGTSVHPPVDYQDSFFKKVAEFYAEIRERNSGAANYNIPYLAAYVWNVGALHALAHTVARAIKALRSTLPSSSDSPYILSNLAGVMNYSQEAGQLAVLHNRYTLLAKDIENLPLPHVTAFDRNRFIYSGFFSDSKGAKPSLISFLPRWAGFFSAPTTSDITDLELQFEAVPHYYEGENTFIDKVLNVMDKWLNDITTNTTYTIIRGDIRNAFGISAYWEQLVTLPMTPLQLIPEDPEVMSQLENLTIIPRDGDAPFEVHYEYREDYGQFVLYHTIDGINDSTVLSPAWSSNRMINYHGNAISDGELLAITRMSYVAVKENNATSSRAIILTSSGDTVYEPLLIIGTSATQPRLEPLGRALHEAQTSVVQSTATDAISLLAFANSVIAHSPLLIFKDQPRAYMWNLDNFAIVSQTNLNNMGVIANRSLWDVHLPRGEHGRLEKKA